MEKTIVSSVPVELKNCINIIVYQIQSYSFNLKNKKINRIKAACMAIFPEIITGNKNMLIMKIDKLTKSIDSQCLKLKDFMLLKINESTT